MKNITLLILIITIQFITTQASGQFHWGVSGGTGSSFLIKGDRSFPIENWGVEGRVLPDWMMLTEVKVGFLYYKAEIELLFGYKFNGYRLQQTEIRPNSLSWTYRNADHRFRGHSTYVGGNFSPTRFTMGKHILVPYVKITGGLMADQEWTVVEQRRSRFQPEESFEYHERSRPRPEFYSGIFAREIYVNGGVGLKFQNPSPKNRFSVFTEFMVHKTLLNNNEVDFGEFYELRVGVGFEFSYKGKGAE